MAIEFEVIGSRLELSPFPVPLSTLGDITVTLWARSAGLPTSGTWKTFFGMWDAAIENYVWLGQDDTGQMDLFVQCYNPGYSDFDLIDPEVFPDGEWVAVAYTYTTATGVHELFKRVSATELVSIGTAVLAFDTNLTTFESQELGNDGTPSQVPVSVALYRQWQRKLTPAQILAEMNSPSAVVSADLYLDSPLFSPSYVNDYSGNGNTWTAVGTLATVDGPVLPAGTYTEFTLADALVDMGSRLYDPQHVRWSVEELTIYVQQALRTFNALTNHFRDVASFDTVNKQAFYDIAEIAPTLRAQTFTVADAVNQICYQLLEPPPNGNLWVGSAQYNLGDILSALQQARDTFLLETGVVVTHRVVPVDANPVTGKVPLPESVINVRRAAWQTSNGYIVVIRRDDAWGITNYGQGWQTPRATAPTAYSVSTTPPLVLQFAPLTNVRGSLDLLTIESGSEPNLLGSTLLGVPDDWAWVVIFGALAQLLQRDGLAVDPARAGYCQSRWDDGLERAKQAAVVIDAIVNGINTPLGSVLDADAYSPDWQMVSGVPRRVLTMGQTIVGLWPPAGIPPGGGSYAVSLDVARNAPVPVELSDPLQIGKELVNDLLDYAQHLALFKEGAGALQTAMGLLSQFTGVCGTTIELAQASQPNQSAAVAQTSQDSRVVAYRIPES